MESNYTRITMNMPLTDAIVAMAEGNPGALTCLIKLLKSDLVTGFSDILLFDALGIYGSKIYMVWNDCCDRDMAKFQETIQAFREGKFSKEEIHENLSQVRAKPFVI